MNNLEYSINNLLQSRPTGSSHRLATRAMVENHKEAVCYSLESLTLGRVYAASVSIETVLTQWIIDTKLRPSSNLASHSNKPRDSLIDFELPFDRGAREQPIVCLSVDPNASTWVGCVFYTLDEARNCAEIARKMGLPVKDFRKLLVRTKASQSIQSSDVLINVQHDPDIPWPNHHGFNGQEENPGFYMFCLPATLRFPQNGSLKLYLPKVAGTADLIPAYPCPSFIVDPATFGGVWDYIRKTKESLEKRLESKLWRKVGRSRVKATGDRGKLESSGYGEPMDIDSNDEIDGNEEMGQDSSHQRKRKQEYEDGEAQKKMKLISG